MCRDARRRLVAFGCQVGTLVMRRTLRPRVFIGAAFATARLVIEVGELLVRPNPKSTQSDVAPERSRQPYTPPRLTVYGSIATLTEAGSGSVKESGFADPNPRHRP